MSTQWDIDLILNILLLAGLFLATYCVRYPDANPFLRNEITYFEAKIYNCDL